MEYTGKKQFIDSETLLHDSFRLAMKVWNDGYVPDQIVAIWRGGTPIGIVIHEYFKFKGYLPQHTAIKCESYDKFNPRSQIEIKGLEQVIEIVNSDDRMLIVDDVFDTGLTLQALLNEIRTRARNNTPEIRIATLFYKPKKNKTKLAPNYFIKKTNSWLVFPHELEGLSEEEIMKKGKKLYNLLHD